MLHDFKAPHDAIKLGDGSIIVNEPGSKSLVRASGEHGKDRTVVIGGLEGPVGLAAGSDGTVYVTEAFAGQVSKAGANGKKAVGAPRQADRRRSRRQADRIDRSDERSRPEIAANLPIGLPAAPDGLPSNIPTGVGATGVIYFSSDIENAIYKVVKK